MPTGGPKQRLVGVVLILIGIVSLIAPFGAGNWALQFLSLAMLAVGVTEVYSALGAANRSEKLSYYATGVIALLGAFVLYISPSLATSGVIVLFLIALLADGVLKTVGALASGERGASQAAAAVNGIWSLLLAFLGYWLWQRLSVQTAIGVAVAGYAAGAGWSMLLSPAARTSGMVATRSGGTHPDPKIDLGPHDLFRTAAEVHRGSAAELRRNEWYWLGAIICALFVLHVGRMNPGASWLGAISPFAATIGDLVMAFLLGAFLIVPMRVVWRSATRRLERRAWQLRMSGADVHMRAFPRRIIQEWTEMRLSFSESLSSARNSLPATASLIVRLGLPAALLFAAINSIWGFTWYFNTESWASAVYQKMTELRVDIWRAAMVDGVKSAYSRQDSDLFMVNPPGVETGDFSFLVIGDPGEGDGSQLSLTERFVEIGRRPDVKFLIVASDVVYPAGAITDYERNFYLPFKGFSKPVYAIPGNHDWFDALEGFNANFLEPKAAAAAIVARAKVDHELTDADSKAEWLIGKARRLRHLYRLQAGAQRAPYFEIQSPEFALLAIDTGIQRSIDEHQRNWLNQALERSQNKLTMAILGHPRYAAGDDTAAGDEAFVNLYNMLEQSGVTVFMAGDTHDFEYYETGQARPTYHFVNGGGGAYLSIGGALAWPKEVPAKRWAYFPGPEAINAKLDTETPRWKLPIWWWIKRFGAWPVSVETLSGIFDFNSAPFYQSFVEVRVERSRQRVVFALQSADGPVTWQGLHANFGAGVRPGAPVEFIVPFRPPPDLTQTSIGFRDGKAR